MKPFTLAFIFNDKNQVLLCAKKKTNSGFIASLGKWNGPGGAVEAGETIKQGMIREIWEETKIEISEALLESAWYLQFRFVNKSDWDKDVHIFVVKDYVGWFEETEEMKPERFNISDIPYERMRDSDKNWLPELLSGKYVSYRMDCDDDGVVLGCEPIIS